MQFGLIVKTALQRAELPFDVEHLDLARRYANDNIQDLWYMVKADFRQGRDSVTTVVNSDEYVLNKLFDGFVNNSFRGGSDNPRNLIYKDPIEFFRYTRNYQNSVGTPNIFTFGDFSGVDEQLRADSEIQVYSSLSSKTTGTVSTVAGSKTIKGIGTAFSLNDVGLRFQKAGDTSIYYKIGKWVSATEIELDEPYRGQTSSGASYKVGDIGVHVNIQGYVGGQVDSEDIVLDGENSATGSKLFGGLIAVSKSDYTGGRIIARNVANTQNIAILAPAELDIERQTVVLWRIPSAVETISYRFYMKHPLLRADTDRLMIPAKYHQLVTYLTTTDLLEWAGRAVPQSLNIKVAEGKAKFVADANDTTLWITIPSEEGLGYGLTDINNRAIDQDFIGF